MPNFVRGTVLHHRKSAFDTNQFQHLRGLIKLSLNAVQAGREAAAPIFGPFHLLERKSSENMDKQLEVANAIKKLEKAQGQVATPAAAAPAALSASSVAATGAPTKRQGRQPWPVF